MANFAHQPSHPPLPPGMPPMERRQASDRREAERGGKYDRRKNRCGLCKYYHPKSPDAGHCGQHQHKVLNSDFACIRFDAV